MAALLGIGILVGCGGTDSTAGDGGPVLTETVTADPTASGPATSAAPDCSKGVPDLSGPVTLSSAGNFYHVGKTVQSGGDSCFGFRIYDGMIGDRTQGAGTGASAVQLLVVFVDGKPVLDPTPYLTKGVRAVKWSATQIDVQFDMRERGIDPESWVDATYRRSGSTVTADRPDFGSRMSVTSFPGSNAAPSTPPSAGTVPLDRFRKGEQFAFRSPTGAIVCVSRGTAFRCETPNAGHRVPATEVCGFYAEKYETAGSNVFMWKDGAACATTLQGMWATADGILQYGESVTVPVPDGNLTCSSSDTGFRCVDVNGRGFSVSRETFARL
ncbi:hypothetical protein ACH46_03040 [Gordonia phthalatica]|uniref:Uncharacterized protein n=1 Tax=Gordonia phthalatica TaxID=1136941 RepID=A0A0N9MNK2_9ACTN|nr:hypothetical protein ACH46_03040 [Gordonia phthalatica]